MFTYVQKGYYELIWVVIPKFLKCGLIFITYLIIRFKYLID
jgi:hypothetical protein